jgi:hypothetical protein
VSKAVASKAAVSKAAPVKLAQFRHHRGKAAAVQMVVRLAHLVATPMVAAKAALAAAEKTIPSVTLKRRTVRANAVTPAHCQVELAAWVARANA